MKKGEISEMSPHCSVCGVELTEENWYPYYRKTNQHRCKECDRKKSKNYYAKNIEKAREKRLLHERKVRQDNPEKARDYWRKYYQRNRKKVLARDISKREVPLGNRCEICGSTENLERHHIDYDKPELVVTLCRECHMKIHRGGYPLEGVFGSEGRLLLWHSRPNQARVRRPLQLQTVVRLQ